MNSTYARKVYQELLRKGETDLAERFAVLINALEAEKLRELEEEAANAVSTYERILVERFGARLR